MRFYQVFLDPDLLEIWCARQLWRVFQGFSFLRISRQHQPRDLITPPEMSNKSSKRTGSRNGHARALVFVAGGASALLFSGPIFGVRLPSLQILLLAELPGRGRRVQFQSQGSLGGPKDVALLRFPGPLDDCLQSPRIISCHLELASHQLQTDALVHVQQEVSHSVLSQTPGHLSRLLVALG